MTVNPFPKDTYSVIYVVSFDQQGREGGEYLIELGKYREACFMGEYQECIQFIKSKEEGQEWVTITGNGGSRQRMRLI